MRAQVAQALHGWGRAVRVAAAGERGSGTVLVVGVIAVLLAAALGVSGLIQAQAAAGRARTADDLAELGGALMPVRVRG